MNKNEKRRTILGVVKRILQSGGKITNPTAQEFIREEFSSNIEIINQISANVAKLSPLNSTETAVLKEVLHRHNLLEASMKSEQHVSQEKTLWLTDSLAISDLSSSTQDADDEYAFMLNHKAELFLPKRIYHVQSNETIGKFTVKFSNYIFGNLCIDKNNINYDKELLMSVLSRKNIVESILESFGFVSTGSSDICSSKEQDEMFFKLCKFQPKTKLKRLDGSAISILKVGDIIISCPNKLDENIEQYLISSNSRFYLSYGKINFQLAESSPKYRYNLANKLLGYENLNKSRYIGSLLGDQIIKNDVPFGKAATSRIKSDLRLAL